MTKLPWLYYKKIMGDFTAAPSIYECCLYQIELFYQYECRVILSLSKYQVCYSKFQDIDMFAFYFKMGLFVLYPPLQFLPHF